MLTEAYPTSATSLLSASAGCAAAALLLLLVARISYREACILYLASHRQPRILLGGALLLCGPFLALLLTGQGINSNSLTLALALVPVVAGVTQTALGDAAPGSFATSTWPALAAITGLLLLIPQPSFANPVTDATLLLAPLTTGIGAALFTTSRSSRNRPTFASALLAAALLFAAAWSIQFLLHRTTAHFTPLAALLDAATALLTLLSLSRIGLTVWSAQFTLVPLIIILQGFVLLRPRINVYNSAGLSLLLLGCIFLLLPQPSEKAV
jgi:drug/metabolite transporter (DMT)-like permease